MSKIAILGAGSFGLTLAWLWSHAGHAVWLWDRSPEKIQKLTANRQITQPVEVHLPDAVALTSNLQDVVADDVEIIVLVVTTKGTRDVCLQLAQAGLKPQTILLNVSKGIELPSLQRISQVMQEACPNNPIAILSGPSLAKEILHGLPTAVSVASTQFDVAADLMQTLSCENQLRIYANPDLIGVELGGALKNIYAIGHGYLMQHQLGDNARAAYLTRGLAELTRLAVALGAQETTLYGLSGLGDLMATCHSTLSRNTQLGVRLAQGQPCVEAMRDICGTVEGVFTTKAVVELSRSLDLELPIAETVYRLVSDSGSLVDPRQLIESLMSRRLRVE